MTEDQEQAVIEYRSFLHFIGVPGDERSDEEILEIIKVWGECRDRIEEFDQEPDRDPYRKVMLPVRQRYRR